MPKIKNIVIFIVIGIILVFIYFYFVKPSSTGDNLVSATPATGIDGVVSADEETVARDFLTLLLNVKNIKLDDTIFSDNAFTSLRDSSITLTSDGAEGRPNPFAPIGVENIALMDATTFLPSNILPNLSITSTTPSATATFNPLETLPIVTPPATPTTVKKP